MTLTLFGFPLREVRFQPPKSAARFPGAGSMGEATHPPIPAPLTVTILRTVGGGRVVSARIATLRVTGELLSRYVRLCVRMLCIRSQGVRG